MAESTKEKTTEKAAAKTAAAKKTAPKTPAPKKETAEKKPAAKKAPAAAKPAAKAEASKSAKNIKVTLVKSLTGRHEKHIATAKSLTLKRIGDTTLQPDNPQTRGKIAKISYLITVTEM